MSRQVFNGKLLDPGNFVGPHLLTPMNELQGLLMRHEGPGIAWDDFLMEIVCIGTGRAFTINPFHPTTEDFYQWQAGYIFEVSGKNQIILLWPKGGNWSKKDGTQADRAISLHATKETKKSDLVQLVADLVNSATRLEQAFNVSNAKPMALVRRDTSTALAKQYA